MSSGIIENVTQKMQGLHKYKSLTEVYFANQMKDISDDIVRYHPVI